MEDQNRAQGLLRIFIIIFFFLTSIRLFYLQIVRGEYYTQKSEENITRTISIPALRGTIYDRNGIPLAGLRPGYQVVLGDSILEDISIQEVIYYEEHKDSLPNMVVKGYPYRLYPFKSISSHLIGWVGESESSPDIRTGKSGIEKVYNEILSGKNGFSFHLADARGVIYDKEVRPPVLPVSGKDITLTLDINISKFVDSLLKEYERGAVIVMKIPSAEILTIISKPGFDLNLLSGKVSKKIWNDLSSREEHPLLNRAIAGLYPPGSIFKLITSLIALDIGIINTQDKIFCTGEYRFGNRVFKDWKKHGWVDFWDALEQSCDVYFYNLGRSIGLTRFLNYLKKLNLQTIKSYDLYGEEEGFVPDREWYVKKYGKWGYGEGNVLNLAIGQGEILLTPLQIAVMVAQIAGNGKIPQPHLILNPEKLDTLILPFELRHLKLMQEGIKRVVQGKRGTGRAARVQGFSVAGKTGTSQNPQGEDHALFVGYAPSYAPEFLVMVVLENAGMGGEKAAPLAGKIFKYLFKKWKGPKLPS